VCTITIATTDLTAIESLPVSFTISGAPAAGTTLSPGAITFVATLAPVAPPTSGGGSCASPFHCSNVPKFLATNSPAYTIANIIVAKTTMLIPYAVSIGANGGTYNTGIAIANTTRDPFGAGGATPTEGTLTFHLYQRSSTGFQGTVSYVTSATANPGSGLSATGTVAAGGLWSGLLSEVLSKQTTLTGDFIGYVFVEANFLNAHGLAYLVTGNSVVSSGLPVGILPPTSAVSRNALAGFTAGGAEVLGF
jgi:hypothetical protein